MVKWQNIKIEGIAYIRKCVAEFDVGEFKKTPWAKFKVKIKEDQDGKLTGYTNLEVKDEFGDFSGAVGFGNTIEEVLEDTILYLQKILDEKETWSAEDFKAADPYDF